MSAPSKYRPPRTGHKFRFKPNTVVEFTDIMPCAITGKPFAWIFENPSGVELLYYPEEIIEYLTDKHLRPT